jgi:hypothetical protein
MRRSSFKLCVYLQSPCAASAAPYIRVFAEKTAGAARLFRSCHEAATIPDTFKLLTNTQRCISYLPGPNYLVPHIHAFYLKTVGQDVSETTCFNFFYFQ